VFVTAGDSYSQCLTDGADCQQDSYTKLRCFNIKEQQRNGNRRWERSMAQIGRTDECTTEMNNWRGERNMTKLFVLED